MSPTSPDFGDVRVGQSTSKTVTVSNEGSETLDVTIGFSGQNASEFAVGSGDNSFSLAPDTSRDLPVEFAPSTMNTCQKSATLDIDSNDPDEGSIDVGLSGTARPDAVWTFPSPHDFDGDCLYEDVNGDGEFNIVDVQALFAHRHAIDERPDAAAFDFNGDNDVDVIDVQRLFRMVVD